MNIIGHRLELIFIHRDYYGNEIIQQRLVGFGQKKRVQHIQTASTNKMSMTYSAILEVKDTQHPEQELPDNEQLSQVLSSEHALSSPQYGVLVGIVRVLFRWNFKHGWNGEIVGINGMANHLSDELIDQYDSNIITLQKTPEGLLYLRHTRLLLHHQEIGLPVLVQLSNPSQ